MAPAETVAPTPPVRVLVCDDHELVRTGLRTLIESAADLTVVAEAGDADAALTEAVRSKPDVVLMDVRMPKRSGVEACRDIRSAVPGARVLMLTSYADDEALFSSIMAGAAGYLLKEVRGVALLQAIRDVAAGRSLLDPTLTARVLARIRGEPGTALDGIDDLTAQERRVLELVAEGMTNRQIGEHVHLAEKTVKNYVSNILMKLGLSRRAEVAAFVVKQRQHRDPEHWS